MNALTITTTVIKLVTSSSTGLIIGNAIKATTPASIKLPAKIAISIGSLVLSALVGDLAAKKVEEQIDDLTKGFSSAPAETTTTDN